MKAAAHVAKLPLRSGRWSGAAGSVLGQGTGSSIDFQDQRPYLPGDDPRHINWQAFARTGHHTMKLYRQEVTPKVDLLFDASASMFLNDAKTIRSWELLYWNVESALRLGASLKVYVFREDVAELPMPRVLAHDWQFNDVPHQTDLPGLLQRVPLRAGSLRVLLSDLLHESAPELVTNLLLQSRGRAMILAPFCHDESQPDWSGNIEFEACEALTRDRRRVEAPTLQRYLQAYSRHFNLWQEACLRRGIAMARVTSEAEFLPALRAEALAQGCVEM
jgi:uncharacterized protein (DUF58 family)